MLDNWKLDLAAALPAFGVLVAVYLLFTFTQRFLSRYPLLRSVGLQLNLLVLTGLCSSNGDARRNIQQGGVTVNDEKINDISKSYSEAELKEGIVIRKGKKTFNKVILK